MKLHMIRPRRNTFRPRGWANLMIPLFAGALLLFHAGCAAPADDDTGEVSDAVASLSFTLIDAVSGKPIAGYDPIANGATITLAALPSQQLTIRANSVAAIGSVNFQLDSAYTHIENFLPYTLCGDQVTTFTPCSQLDTVGAHTLIATPYSGAKLSGTRGTPTSLSFTIVPHSVALAFGASTTGGVTYSIYRATTSGGPYTRVATGLTTTSYTDGTVQSGSTYFYVATAVSGASESVHSNQVTATIP